MKPTQEQKRQFRAKHHAVLEFLQEAFEFRSNESTKSVSMIEQALLDADKHGADFASMRHSQIDREIQCEM